MHIHCTTKFLELTFKEMKSNKGKFLLSKPVLAPLKSGCPKFPKHVLNPCIIMLVLTGANVVQYTLVWSYIHVNDKRKIRCKSKLVELVEKAINEKVDRYSLYFNVHSHCRRREFSFITMGMEFQEQLLMARFGSSTK